MRTFHLLILATTFTLINACASKPGMKSRDVDEYYVSTGVERYFLPEIPGWANFSQTSGCFRGQGLKYLNIDTLMKSYSLSFFEAIQLQATFNEEHLSIKKAQAKDSLTLKEDEIIFFKASEKVGSKIYFTDLPSFKRIHLIWLDEIQGDKTKEAKLKAFLTSSTNDEGVPVLVSACMTKEEIEKFIPDANYKSISAELFSIYNSKGETVPSMHVNLLTFFKPDQKIYFYSQSLKDKVQDIQGNYKNINY